MEILDVGDIIFAIERKNIKNMSLTDFKCYPRFLMIP
jgi:hypothetical protein